MSPRVTALIPFFGGKSSATHSKTETRLDYLKKTIESIAELGWDFTVFQTKEDKVKVPESHIIDVESIWLPYAMVDACHHEGFIDLGDLVYVTEADQILHIADEDVFEIPNEERYLAPWRLDLVGPNGEAEYANGRYKLSSGEMYGITNGASLLGKDYDPFDVIPVHSSQGSFSGAFLCTAGYFRRIKFRKMQNLPVEHATGLDAKSAGLCVKTANVERFYVDHLSPRERWGVVEGS